MNDINSALNGPLTSPPVSDAALQQQINSMLDVAWKALWNHHTDHAKEPENDPPPPEWVDRSILDHILMKFRTPPTAGEVSEINGQIAELRTKFQSFLTPHPDDLVAVAQPSVDAIAQLGLGSGSKAGPKSNYNAQTDFADAAGNDLLEEGFKGTAASAFFTHYPGRHAGRYTNQIYALNAVDGAMKLYAGIHHQARTDVLTIAKEAEKKLRPMMKDWDGQASSDDLKITLAVVATIGTVVAVIASSGGAAVAAAGTASAMWSRIGAAAAIGNSFNTLKSNKDAIVAIFGSNAEEVLKSVNKALDDVRSGIDDQKKKLVQGITAARGEMNRMWDSSNGSTNVLQVPAPGEVQAVEGG